MGCKMFYYVVPPSTISHLQPHSIQWIDCNDFDSRNALVLLGPCVVTEIIRSMELHVNHIVKKVVGSPPLHCNDGKWPISSENC